MAVIDNSQLSFINGLLIFMNNTTISNNGILKLDASYMSIGNQPNIKTGGQIQLLRQGQYTVSEDKDGDGLKDKDEINGFTVTTPVVYGELNDWVSYSIQGPPTGMLQKTVWISFWCSMGSNANDSDGKQNFKVQLYLDDVKQGDPAMFLVGQWTTMSIGKISLTPGRHTIKLLVYDPPVGGICNGNLGVTGIGYTGGGITPIVCV